MRSSFEQPLWWLKLYVRLAVNVVLNGDTWAIGGYTIDACGEARIAHLSVERLSWGPFWHPT